MWYCVCACVWHLTEDKCDRNGVSGPIICNIRPATFKSTHIRAIFRVTATFCADSFNPKSSHPSSFTLSLHPPLFCFFFFPPTTSSLHCSRLCSFSPVIQAMREMPALPLASSPSPISQKLSYLPPSSFFVSLHLPFHSSLQVLLHLPTNPLSFTPPFPSPFLSFTFPFLHLSPSVGHFPSLPSLSYHSHSVLGCRLPRSLSSPTPIFPLFASTLAAQD